MIPGFLHERKRLVVIVERLLPVAKMFVTVADIAESDTEAEWLANWASHFQHVEMYVERALVLSELRVSRSEITDQHRIDVANCQVDCRCSIVHRETILSVAQLAVHPTDIHGHVGFAARVLCFFVKSSGFGV